MRVKMIPAAFFAGLLLCSCFEPVNGSEDTSYNSETVTSAEEDGSISENYENIPFYESDDTLNCTDQVIINPNPEKSSGGHVLAAVPMTAET